MSNTKPIYRAWCKSDFETKDGPLMFVQKKIGCRLYFVMKTDPAFKYPFEVPFMDSDWILEAYTGLKDSSGKRIFEGDIVRVHIPHETNSSYVSDVGISFDGAQVACSPAHIVLDISNRKLSDFCGRYSKICKVIGNLRQNPELLKEYTDRVEYKRYQERKKKC